MIYLGAGNGVSEINEDKIQSDLMMSIFISYKN